MAPFTITIHATVKSTVPLATTVSNQATISYDANADGTNDTTVVTDDPRRGRDRRSVPRS